ncbi:hypothetical protein KIW84_012854 [Lathyrus oleraceus]|uniref:Uncharacterized protein n=1 Tax=Pisum sativum TaxID=3888 RepID=A0A9D5BIY3_PEA|nr:hypothetical protein KIW84_012854 [Pisum sativum]
MPKKKAKKIVICWKINQVVETRGEEASREQNGSPVEGTCGYLRLVMSGYARVGYRCRCAQAAMERRLSFKEAERQCLYQRAMLSRGLRGVLGQHDESYRKEHAIYLSKKFTDCETIHSLLGELDVLWHRLLANRDSICWFIPLCGFQDGSDQKTIKGSVLSDYLAQQPVEDYQLMKFEFPDEDISRCVNRKIESN